MKFLGEPYLEDGYQIIRTDALDRYRLKDYEEWEKLKILQEPGGWYAVVSKDGYSIGFYYEKIEKVGEYLLAYFSTDDTKLVFHVYDTEGVVKRYAGKLKIVGESYEAVESILIVTIAQNITVFIGKEVLFTQNAKYVKLRRGKYLWILEEQDGNYNVYVYKICSKECVFKGIGMKNSPYLAAFHGDSVVIGNSFDHYRRYQIYYKGILIKTMYRIYSVFDEDKYNEMWKDVEEKNGFIKVQGLGSYYLDFEKKKAYSKWGVTYWKKRYMS